MGHPLICTPWHGMHTSSKKPENTLVSACHVSVVKIFPGSSLPSLLIWSSFNRKWSVSAGFLNYIKYVKSRGREFCIKDFASFACFCIVEYLLKLSLLLNYEIALLNSCKYFINMNPYY